MGSTDEAQANVLVVDDDDDLARVIADVIASEGHQPRIARNGAEGLDRIYERRPDLIVLDIQMPVLDGPSMIGRLTPFDDRGETIPFVLVSGHPGIENIAARLGTPYFLRKPFGPRALVEIVESALQGRPVPHKERRQAEP